jgi:Fe-S cluster biogenesis protein NfuA
VSDSRISLNELRAEPDDLGERLAALNKLLDLMRPAVQADGGDLVLVSADVSTGVIHVELRGACSSCAISGSTLEEGVSRLLKERLGWVSEVHGAVQEVDDWDASAALGRGGWIANET